MGSIIIIIFAIRLICPFDSNRFLVRRRLRKPKSSVAALLLKSKS